MDRCRKDGSSSTVMYTEDMEKDKDLPEDHYTESELKEMETLYLGTESKARKRFQRNGPYRQSSFSRPRSLSQDSRYDRSRSPLEYDRSQRDVR